MTDHPSFAQSLAASPVGHAERRPLQRLRRLVQRRRLRPPIGLALSGGATLGAAHVGILRALQDEGIALDQIAGTSIGAVAAALHAFNTPIDGIEEIALEMSWLSISSFRPSRLGLLANERLGTILEEAIGTPDFEDAPIPLGVVATDIGTGERVVLDRGPVAPAVLASACVPGVFQPVEHAGRLLVDGGLVDNLPGSLVRSLGARTVIGADLNTGRRYQTPTDLIDVVLNATDIAINNATRLQASDIDLHIAPTLSSYGRLRSRQGPTLIDEGYVAAQRALASWHRGSGGAIQRFARRFGGNSIRDP